MEKSDLTLVGAILLLLGAVEIIALVLAGATTHDVAAWVEALGVLAAFGGSIYLARRAEREARQLRILDGQRAMTKRIMELDGLVFKTMTFANSLPAWVLLAKNGQLQKDDFRLQQATVLAELMRTVPILGLPSFSFVDVLADLRAKLHRVDELLNERQFIHGTAGAVVRSDELDQAVAVAATIISDCEAYIRVSGYYLANGVPP